SRQAVSSYASASSQRLGIRAVGPKINPAPSCLPVHAAYGDSKQIEEAPSLTRPLLFWHDSLCFGCEHPVRAQCDNFGTRSGGFSASAMFFGSPCAKTQDSGS